MATLRCMNARRCRFITRDSIYVPIYADQDRSNKPIGFEVKDGFEALAMAFKRNRVLMNFDMQDVDVRDYYKEPAEFTELREEISKFCDNNCTGLWTWSYKYQSSSAYDPATSGRINEDLGTAYMTIQFEQEDDIAMFLRQCAVVIKLTY